MANKGNYYYYKLLYWNIFIVSVMLACINNLFIFVIRLTLLQFGYCVVTELEQQYWKFIFGRTSKRSMAIIQALIKILK